MPELNLNYAPTPPWLAPNQDNSAFENLLASTRTTQQGRQLNMQEKQLAARLKTEQQDQVMNDLKIGETIRQRDQLLDVEASMQALTNTVTPLLRSHQPTAAVDEILAWGSEDYRRMKHPAWQELLKGAQASVTVETARQQLQQNKLLQKSQIYENRQQGERAAAAAELDRVKATDIGLGETPGFKTTKLDSGHLIIQDTARGAIHVIDPTKATVQAHLKAFSAEDSALQKQLTGIENSLMLNANPTKKAAAIAEVQSKRAAAREKYLGKMLEDQAATATPTVTTVTPEPQSTTPTIEQDKVTLLESARDAIRQGASRDAVIKRLREFGITEEP